MLSVLFGISTALCWGVADFVGGATSRRVGAFGMTLGTIGGGLLLLLPVALSGQVEPISLSGWLWCLLAGAFDAAGIFLLYLSMTAGRISLAAPVSALTAAALPTVYGIATQGVPGVAVVAGLILALAAVWMVFQSPDAESLTTVTFADLRLPLLSGSCLGMFLILMHAGSGDSLIWPMVAVRCGGVAVLLLIGFLSGKMQGSLAAFPWVLVLLNALLDVGGNGCYILAGQLGRVDVAAVLSSLYPGATVFMAWIILKERIGRTQLTGIVTALAAIALLTV